jgi:hypothetical protein
MSAGLDTGIGIDLSVFGSIGESLSRVASMMENRENRRRKLFEQLHQVPIACPDVPIFSSAGVLQMPDTLSPKAGYMWSVRRLAATGFSAGTVLIYKNGAVIGNGANATALGGEAVAPFASAGVLTFGRGELLMDQNDQLIITASNITLTVSGGPGVQIGGAADCFERWLLPEYLG